MQTSIGWGPATIAAIVAGIIAYGILVFATGAVTFEDLQSLPLIGSLFRNRKKD